MILVLNMSDTFFFGIQTVTLNYILNISLSFLLRKNETKHSNVQNLTAYYIFIVLMLKIPFCL